MKIFRAYIITVIACISIASIISCVFIADENARKISLGEDFAVVAMKDYSDFSEKNMLNPLPLLNSIAEEIKKAASIAPPPISNIYWFMQGTAPNQK